MGAYEEETYLHNTFKVTRAGVAKREFAMWKDIQDQMFDKRAAGCTTSQCVCSLSLFD